VRSCSGIFTAAAQRKALECRNSFTPACKPPWTGSPSDIPLV
jgi:hypothetical protein